jgi:hypothetical protein
MPAFGGFEPGEMRPLEYGMRTPLGGEQMRRHSAPEMLSLRLK